MGLTSGAIDVVGGAMTQYRTSVNHLMAISQARRKMKQEDEDRAFEKKKRELELEELQRKGRVSDLEFDILNSQLREYNKQQEQIAKGRQVTIKQAEHKEKTLASQALNFTQSVFRHNPKLAQNFLESVRLPGEQRGDELEPTTSYGRLGFRRRKSSASTVKPISTIEQILIKKAKGEQLSPGEVEIFNTKFSKPLKSTSTTEQIKQLVAEGKTLTPEQQKYHDLYIKEPKKPKEITNKEIMDEARSIAKADGDESKWREYIQEAKAVLGGELPTKNDLLRSDGSEKGPGFLGTFQLPDGKIATEISIGVEFDGKKMEIPSLVPTLSNDEVKYLLEGNKPTRQIVDKAVAHARKRISQKKSVFADESDVLKKSNTMKGLTQERITGPEITEERIAREKQSKIKVKAPDGRVGYIPRSKLEEAKRRGFTVL